MQGRGSVDPNPGLSDDAVPPSNSTFEEASRSGNASGAPLNFRVSESFRREFKIFAAQHGLKLNELLRRSFEVYRRTNDN